MRYNYLKESWAEIMAIMLGAADLPASLILGAPDDLDARHMLLLTKHLIAYKQELLERAFDDIDCALPDAREDVRGRTMQVKEDLNDLRRIAMELARANGWGSWRPGWKPAD